MKKFLLDLRQAEYSDRKFVIDLSIEVFSIYGPYGEILGEYFNNPYVITKLIRIKEKSNPDFVNAGFIMFYMFEENGVNICDISAIAIKPEFQQKGIGRSALSSLCTEIFYVYGAHKIQLSVSETNSYGIEFFRKTGFNIIEPESGYYPQGQTSMRMELVPSGLKEK
ncbi:MAG: GNAT family N-acetyltransferase [Candidatus Coatesbacteria bacterium]|nr:GNAT family N-acetyltransferase [Candidatus Coatesbacteria bacterium]